MPNAKVRLNPIVQSLSIIILGLGVGWLSGLSVSPVIVHVLGALLGLGAGIVAGIRTVQTPESERAEPSLSSVSAFPAALLVLGIALGAPLGILARTHAIFGVTGLESQLTHAPFAPRRKGDSRGTRTIRFTYERVRPVLERRRERRSPEANNARFQNQMG